MTEPIREVRCIHCGDYTPGVYEAHHKEMIRQLKTALEACHLQMLQSNNDSKYAMEASSLAKAALKETASCLMSGGKL